MSAAAWSDALRLSMGTFTAIRVRPPRSAARVVAGRAMLLAPFIGLLLGVAAACVLFAAREASHRPLLASALALAFLALMTRGRHLAGLAEIGPAGVVTLVFVVLLQTLALAEAVHEGHGTQGIITACVVGRLAAVWGCVPGIPAAHPVGFGSLVAGSVSRPVAAALTGLVTVATVAYGGWIDDDASRNLAALAAVAVAVGLAVGFVALGLAIRRLGGITGEVLGVMLEVATLGTLLVLAY